MLPISNEASALSPLQLPTPPESEYEAIYAAVTESARGRWFLDEFARRNRNADTLQVLTAVERLESVMRDTRGHEPSQSLRTELRQMAATIAQTRAEVDAPAPEPGPEPEHERSAIAAAVERIQEVAWSMREHGLDPAICGQIEALASAIRSASWLERPDDDRAQKLGAVLGYLEHRIGSMLGAPEASTALVGPEQRETAIAPPQAATVSSATPEPPAHVVIESPGNIVIPATGVEQIGTLVPTSLDPVVPAEPIVQRPAPPAAAVPAPPWRCAAELIPVAELAPPVAADATPPPAAAPADAVPAPPLPVASGPAPLPQSAITPVEGDIPETSALQPQPRAAPSIGPVQTVAPAAQPPAAPRAARAHRAPLLPNDPLAAVKAMSEAERLALFM